MTKKDYEYLKEAGYLYGAIADEVGYDTGSPVATFDPISPMICQSNHIAYNMAELANANFSALHTEQAARMDDICTQFATPYNEAKIEGIMHVPLKTKYTIEDLLPKEDLETLRAIMWASFTYGVAIPFCIMWLICDKLLPFF